MSAADLDLDLDLDLERDGFALFPSAVPADALEPFIPAFDGLATRALGPDAFVVRATCFDRTERANWPVAWHQDVTIPVRERRAAVGFDGWSTKEGVVHVRPPLAVLESMVAIRVHLDEAHADGGALRVLAGTHCAGRLSPDGVRAARASGTPVDCVVPAGGAMVMRPLLLHSSKRAVRPRHRRVVHFEFAASALGEGVEWDERLGTTPAGSYTHSSMRRSIIHPSASAHP
ncbi:MAG: phytanoyl-CoA dioxygenase family protein [bacterium]|nr:phytanoyl-CoA dioxygenase family protein [bacterium]